MRLIPAWQELRGEAFTRLVGSIQSAMLGCFLIDALIPFTGHAQPGARAPAGGEARTAAGAAGSVASESAPAGSSQLGGPEQVDRRIEEDSLLIPHWQIRFLQPYHDFKTRLQEDIGLGYGIDYSAVALGATGSAGDSWSAGGMVRLFGSWDLVDRGGRHAGGLVLKGEHRHGYSAVPPSGFGLETGYVGLQVPPFSDEGFRLTNLYWRQTFADKRVVLLGGYVDATDYVDTYALASPWTHFMNFAFSTGGGSLAVPDPGLGFTLGVWLTERVYVLASVNDRNSDPTQPWETFARFFTEHQFFTSAELGWVSARERAYFDNLHVTGW